MAKRDQDVHFLASKEEVERIHEKMDELGIRSMGAYLRKMALNRRQIRPQRHSRLILHPLLTSLTQAAHPPRLNRLPLRKLLPLQPLRRIQQSHQKHRHQPLRLRRRLPHSLFSKPPWLNKPNRTTHRFLRLRQGIPSI